jgi:outer membrane receptor for ferrienterochelin and colicins
VSQDFASHSLNAKYELTIGNELKLQPSFQFRSQKPWNTRDQAARGDDGTYYDKTVERFRGGLAASYDNIKELFVTVGVIYDLDRARLNDPGPNDENITGLNTLFGEASRRSVSYNNGTVFAEASSHNPYVNVTAGVRYEHHSQFGNSFVPRLTLTKMYAGLHGKFMIGKAFKAPGFENASLEPHIRPETMIIYEIELGYELSPNIYAGVNGFDLSLDRAIVYGYDSVADAEKYYNAGRTGSRGLEAVFQMKYKWGSLNASYSFYDATGRNKVKEYAVEGLSDVLLGMPQHKVFVAAGVEPIQSFTITSSFTFLSKRYDSVQGPTDPTYLLNLYAFYRDLLVRGLHIGVGVSNLLGDDFKFVQAYNSGHPLLPGLDREYLARVAYTCSF